MRFRKLLPVLLTQGLVLTSCPSTASGLKVLGFDDMSCAAWIKSKDDPDLRSAYVVWVRGFLTGHNYALPNQQVSSFSSSTLEMKLNQYCKSNPAGSFIEGAMRMSDEFSGRNQPIRK